jgi:MoaA/NifB/PqqE/SkfB family radical SAM enzyme
MDKFDIDIDIGGACNLQCPSCPQGNIRDYRLPHGFMTSELLERIVEKTNAECQEVKISLFNWAEPLLHPRLPELINIVQDAGIPCHLSSNLNILPDADAMMAANPVSLRISNSGFSQEVYGYTHKRGNIEKVKKHMIELAEAKKRHQASTGIHVYYHRYLHNLGDEPLMRDFARDCGFYFHPVWALFFPLEKILIYLGEEGFDFSLTEEDRSLISNLALPLHPALAAARKYQSRPCRLRENEISLDFKGNFTLCCGVFDARKYTLGNYLDIPLEDIQKLRHSHPLCGTCMRQGAHVYMTYGIEEMDELVLRNLDPADVKLLDLNYEKAWEHWEQRLVKIYNRYFAEILSAGQKDILADNFFRIQRYLRRLRRKRFNRSERL